MNVVILTAGGTGSRINKNIPKQFLTVNEIPIIIYTLKQFQNNRNINKIALACLKEWQPVLRAYKQEFGISKLEYIVDGGETGLDSIENCLSAITGASDDDNIIIHDGNRPLVTNEIIDENIRNCTSQCSVTTIVDINDGLFKVDENNNVIDNAIRRESIKRTQTPHTFKYKMIKEIFAKIDDKTKYISVSDAGSKLGYKTKLVYGSDMNFKITIPDDIVLFKMIIDARSKNA